MIRGTTPTHTFMLPFEPPAGSAIRVVYAQGEDHKEQILFERETSSCSINGSTVVVKLTPEETCLFDCTPRWCDGVLRPYPVKIQVGVRTPANDILWGNIIVTTVERCLRKDGVV